MNLLASGVNNPNLDQKRVWTTPEVIPDEQSHGLEQNLFPQKE